MKRLTGFLAAFFAASLLAAQTIFVPAPPPKTYVYVPVTPCRVYDSRLTSPLLQDAPRSITVTGTCNVPGTGVGAVSVNIALANIQGMPPTNGVLSVGVDAPLLAAPTPEYPFPWASIAWLNYPDFQRQISNSGIAPVNANGNIKVAINQGTGSADVIVDVNGYLVEGLPATKLSGGWGLICGQTFPSPGWSKCTANIVDISIVPGSNIQATYDTRGSDDQIPLRVFNVHVGGFSVEGQTGQTFHWLSYNP